MPSKKEQALAAISAANPNWSKRQVAFAYEKMPTTVEWAYAKGTYEREQARKVFLSQWTKWAIEVGIFSGDTPIPEEVKVPEVKVPRRRNEPLTTEQIKQNALAATQAKIPGAKLTPPPSDRPQRNGVTSPKVGTIAKRLWNLCDELTAKLGRQCIAQEVVDAAVAQGLNPGNAKTEFSGWRKFNA